MESIDGQIKALKEHYVFIDPVEIPLGDRLEQVLNPKTSLFYPKLVNETFHYVPIIDVLKLILSHPFIQEYVTTELQNTDGWLCKFSDGHFFRHSEFFKKYPQALRIQLYYDDLTVNNPLGSKVQGHKLGVFYYNTLTHS